MTYLRRWAVSFISSSERSYNSAMSMLFIAIVVCGFIAYLFYSRIMKDGGKEVDNFEPNSNMPPAGGSSVLSAKNSRWKGFRTSIAGLNHHEASEVIHSLRAGMTLALVREPTNRYDKNAVRIYSGKYFLGYIPAVDVQRVSQSMDNGESVSAEVARVYIGNNSSAFQDSYAEVSIRVNRHYS